MTEVVPGTEEAAEPPASPQPSPDVPHNMETEQLTPTKYSIMSRNGFGTAGKHISLLVNLFEVSVNAPDTLRSAGADGSLCEESKRSKHSFQLKTFMVEISFAAKIPMQSIAFAPKWVDSDANSEDALRVLDTVLRQRAADCGCLLVRQSFFHDDPRNFTDVGAGVTAVSDVSTTVIIKPGPVIDFLLSNQQVKEPRYIDWEKAKKVLKNLRVQATHRNLEFKISGLSEKPCNQQLFSMKVKNDNGSNEGQTVEITVYEYFVKHCGIDLPSSYYFPCLDVGKPNRPNYLPLEAVGNYCCDDDPVLAACGISVDKQLALVEGRVLEAPQTLLQPSHIDYWAVVNFSARCDTSYLSRELIRCGMSKGINIERPHSLVEEEPQLRRSNPVARVVGSRCWPLISRYRASVRLQASKVEMIDALYKPLENGGDDGIIRDGVSESQFQQVLTFELDQIIKAYQRLGEDDVPKFTVIVAQKNHHTKLFQANSPENVPPGTVVDTAITHPRNYDFYMCAHAGMMGTSRPVHYHVLLDEIGFSADGLQNLIHSLSYVNQRSTTATSVVAPICYAHHAAAQIGRFLDVNDLSETGLSSTAELPRLHKNIRSSMFFC
ncbi:Protein argonaute 6 [Vigna angularis]|uniref:Protein argonaute 6 n=1 Tax=Phaseolus angularis TaxID=3914 RepID=A0A8T0KAK7_PHAAN|nr:Protein argonaute 6 [Vigna angularis]